jgi:hypothetical protein
MEQAYGCERCGSSSIRLACVSSSSLPVATPVLQSASWILALCPVFGSLTVSRYRRRGLAGQRDNGDMTEASTAEVLGALADNVQLRVYLRDGMIDAIPAKRSRRRLLLAEIVQAFEPGVRYSERQVNDVLRAPHPDHAALRRYLVDEQLMDRAGGEYWRIGGPVPL